MKNQSLDGNTQPNGIIRKGVAYDLSNLPENLFDALRLARHRFGGSTEIVQDTENNSYSYNDLVRAAYALGGKIASKTKRRHVIGIILPTAPATVIALFALYAIGRTPAILNYVAGERRIEEACRIAKVSHILTSRRFVAAAGLSNVISKLETTTPIFYLEDLRQSLTLIDKFIAFLRAMLPIKFSARAKRREPAAILFTSGSTGAPKGVALSHENILANIAQCRAHVPFQKEWKFFNALPVFHAFGLTDGVLLPVIGGMKTVLYPSPLDRERIPLAIKSTNANVLVTTDTFARSYASAAKEDALQSLKYIVLGGEAVSKKTIAQLGRKSEAAILEGYGVTECAPVISFNSPERNRLGSVGQLLPGIEVRLDPITGIAAGKKLLVRGPNVMLGYCKDDRDGFSTRSSEEWFDTGDLAEFDADGFLFIKGRAKRFAKVGAEMVSLAAIEEHAKVLWPHADHAALAILQYGDRESVALVTTQPDAARLEFAEWARGRGIPPFEVPHRVISINRIPVLATGKPDFQKLRDVIERKLSGAEVSELYEVENSENGKDVSSGNSTG